ncbi:MAG: hypothetical protein LBI02_03545 [Opitutaceae bacterium]|jgi:hypothetical protein|nr:hypothetical protein [Opitutaceae bacterium]
MKKDNNIKNVLKSTGRIVTGCCAPLLILFLLFAGFAGWWMSGHCVMFIECGGKCGYSITAIPADGVVMGVFDEGPPVFLKKAPFNESEWRQFREQTPLPPPSL